VNLEPSHRIVYNFAMGASVTNAGSSGPDLAASDRLRGLVFDLMRFALHDGPGIRTTVFLKGCPLHCWWCHNPESQRREPELIYHEERCTLCADCMGVCPHGAVRLEDGKAITDPALCQQCGECVEVCVADARRLAGQWMSVDDVVAEVTRDQILFEESGGGVTLSGGEPLMQAAFAEELLAALHGRGIHTVLDTCGFANPKLLRRVSPHVDLFHYDLKLMDAEKHRQFTGVSNDLILANLKMLAEQGSAVIVRMPIIPTVNDGEEAIAAASCYLRQLGLRNVDLLPYHRIASGKYRRLHQDYRLEDLEPPSAEQMEALAARFRHEGFTVRIGGA
jgi:pyruvate formate lyase activating enzyme